MVANQNLKQSNKATGQLGSVRLTVVSGINKGKKYKLGGKYLTMGRGKENNIVFLSTKISKAHARIEVKSGRLLLTDLGASNGTFVNGERVRSKYLSPNDKVSLGKATEIVISGEFSSRKEDDFTLGDVILDAKKLESSELETSQIETETKLSSLASGDSDLSSKSSVKKAMLLMVLLIGLAYIASKMMVEPNVDQVTKVAEKEDFSDGVRSVAPYNDKFRNKRLDFAKNTGQKGVRSRSQREADLLFFKAKHIYMSNRFHDAILGFREVLLFDKNHQQARMYLERAETELANLIDLHDKNGRQLYESLRFKQAEVEFRIVMNLLHNRKTDPRYGDAKRHLRLIKSKTKRY